MEETRKSRLLMLASQILV